MVRKVQRGCSVGVCVGRTATGVLLPVAGAVAVVGIRRRVVVLEAGVRECEVGAERRFFTAEAPDCTSGRWIYPGCCANPESVSTVRMEKAAQREILCAGVDCIVRGVDREWWRQN